MYEVFLDTETTGLSHRDGHKIVEIACIETQDLIPTGNVFHKLINPKRSMPDAAFNVHGFSAEFLKDKESFNQIADEFLNFIKEKKIIIHNAPFDLGFLDGELSEVKKNKINRKLIVDSLVVARNKFPGSSNSLDALCRRFGIDNSARLKHGALLDSEILAEVYLELIGGRQPDFSLSVVGSDNSGIISDNTWVAISRPIALKSLLTEEETKAHNAFVESLGEAAVWKFK